MKCLDCLRAIHGEHVATIAPTGAGYLLNDYKDYCICNRCINTHNEFGGSMHETHNPQ
jgi:hypothetical protein